MNKSFHYHFAKTAAILLCVGFLALPIIANAVNPYMVKDIYPGAPDGYPQNLIDVNGIGYFIATDATNGQELWRTDGTASGTYMVKDIYTGSGNSSPTSMTYFNGDVYFSATDATNGTELWKTDGTTAGTVLVKDINSGSASSSPYSFALFDNLLYFNATDVTNGTELWKTDGTTAGTVLVKNINPGSANSSPAYPTLFNNLLYFSATDATNGAELWKSDGTAAGTVLVKDIRSGSSSSSPSDMKDFNGTLFFRATDGAGSNELWKSDGTTAGTVLVKDINPGAGQSSYPQRFAILNNKLLFMANDGTNGNEPWLSDGTSGGTFMIKDIYTGANGSTPGPFVVVNSIAYFAASDATNSQELWKTDGTADGTVLVKDIYPGIYSGNPMRLTNVNNIIYFYATDNVNGYELWKTDGTTAGTVLVKDIIPGTGGSTLSFIVYAPENNILYFNYNYVGVSGKELWILDLSIPTSVISAPAEGAIVSGSTITLDSISTDNIGVVGVQFYYGANPINAEVTEVSSPNTYSTNWDTTGLPDGDYILTAVARDAADNYTTSSNITVALDNTVPSISYGSISAWNKGDITIPYTLTDADSDAINLTVQYSTDNLNWSTATKGTGGDDITGLTSSPSGTSHSFVWATGTDLPTTEDSTVWVKIVPSDSGVRLTAYATSSFGVDNIGPMGTMTIAEAITKDAVISLILDASSVGSPVVTMQFSNDGATWSAPEAYATSKDWNLVTGEGGSSTQGSRTVYAQFRDSAGNLSADATDFVIYTTVLPAITILPDRNSTVRRVFSPMGETSTDQTVDSLEAVKMIPSVAANDFTIFNGTSYETLVDNDATTYTKLPIFRGKTTPRSKVFLQIHGNEVINTETTSDAYGNWSYQVTQALSKGAHTLSVTVKDQLDNVLSTKSYNFTVAEKPDEQSIQSLTLIYYAVGILVAGILILWARSKFSKVRKVV